MSTEISNESAHVVDEVEFAALARYVLDQMHVHPQAELSIIFVDVPAMTELHVRWMDELRPGSETAPSAEGMLGDVVVCPEVAATQAREAGHSAQEEMLLLVTHGILHLLGFDHAEPEEREEMFTLQRTLLLTFLAGRATR